MKNIGRGKESVQCSGNWKSAICLHRYNEQVTWLSGVQVLLSIGRQLFIEFLNKNTVSALERSGLWDILCRLNKCYRHGQTIATITTKNRIYLYFFSALNRFRFFFSFGFENFLWSIEFIAFNLVLAFETCYRYLLSIYTPKQMLKMAIQHAVNARDKCVPVPV